jgi:hypothetical protein
VLVNYIREYQIANGVSKAHAYDATLYILAGLLVLGLILNLLIRPVAGEHFMPQKDKAKASDPGLKKAGPEVLLQEAGQLEPSSCKQFALVLFAWLAVGIPLAYGLWNTVQQAVVLFR